MPFLQHAYDWPNLYYLTFSFIQFIYVSNIDLTDFSIHFVYTAYGQFSCACYQENVLFVSFEINLSKPNWQSLFW